MKPRIGFALLLIWSIPVWAGVPELTNVEPKTVKGEGGLITVDGSGFAADATVKVGNYPCTDVKIISSTQFSCTAPVNIARKVDIVLTNANGDTATLKNGLTYEGTPTFQLLQARVFQRFALNQQGVLVVYKCSGCHGGQKPDGQLDTKDYSSVIKKVTPGDPAKSKLYREVVQGKMPPPARQPGLSPEEQAAIEAWILDGAPNN